VQKNWKGRGFKDSDHQGCPMVYYQNKYPNLGRRALDGKMLQNLWTLEIFYGSLGYCGNNGQGDRVDNLYSKRVKSILTGHKQKHLHLYQINGRSRLGSNSGSDLSKTRISNNFV
jgi:hypothetical protein